jgi:hypothetical protein
MEAIKDFDTAHRVSRAFVIPLEETGIKINSKSIAAWQKYERDYNDLKAEENTGEGEVFMRPMPSIRSYLEKENFMEKEQRRLRIGTYSGNSTLRKLHLEKEQQPEIEAPPVLDIVRIPEGSDELKEEHDIDLNDAFLEKEVVLKPRQEHYKCKSFTAALKEHTKDLDAAKKALWNDCVVFLSNESKTNYSVAFLRKHAFPDKLFVLQKLNQWKKHMNTLGKQHMAHEIVITNMLSEDIKVSDIPYRLDQVDKLRTLGKKPGAYTIHLVGNRSII